MEVRKIPLGLKDQEIFSIFPEACCFVKISSSLGIFFSKEPKEKELQLSFALKKVVESFEKKEKKVPFSFSFLKETEKGEFVVSVSFTEKEERTTKYPFLKDALAVLIEEEVKEGVLLFLAYGEKLYETMKEVIEEVNKKTKKKVVLKKVKVQSFKKDEVKNILVRKKTLRDSLKELSEKGKSLVNKFGKKGIIVFFLALIGIGFYHFLTNVNLKGKEKQRTLPVKNPYFWKKKNEELLSKVLALYKEGVIEALGKVSGGVKTITYYSYSPCPLGKEKEKLGSLRKCLYLLKGKGEEKETVKVKGKYIVKRNGLTVFLIGEGNDTLSVPASRPVEVKLIGKYLFLSEGLPKVFKGRIRKEKGSENGGVGIFKQS